MNMKMQIQNLQLKITLSQKPAIWRKVIVSKNYTFLDLHQIIQDSMGWNDSHLFEFQVNNPITGKSEILGFPDSESCWDGVTLDSKERRLSSIFISSGISAFYIYDFGDMWRHSIETEEIDYEEVNLQSPLCIAGVGVCPSDDSGGIENYTNVTDSFSPEYVVFRNLPVKYGVYTVWEQELWLRKLLQCEIPLDELVQELSGKIVPADIKELAFSLKNGDLRHRNRALGILGYYKGIDKAVIQDHLFIQSGTIRSYVSNYQKYGIDQAISSRKRKLKYENDTLKEKIIEILHSPPSEYGFNRSSWILDDIKEVMQRKGFPISKNYVSKLISLSGFKYYKAKVALTSTDPNYREKVEIIKDILRNLSPRDKFFSIDEYGPIAIKIHGGKSLSENGTPKIVPQWQRTKGSLILTAALNLADNQLVHFYSDKKNTKEMLRLIELILARYSKSERIYLSWDSASWHMSKELFAYVDKHNITRTEICNRFPEIILAPLPSCAQFLNVIESVFSGLARAIIHNSDYNSIDECKEAIDKYIANRNKHFLDNPQKAGNKIWGKERTIAEFKESNSCKDPAYR
jgi:transposase